MGCLQIFSIWRGSYKFGFHGLGIRLMIEDQYDIEPPSTPARFVGVYLIYPDVYYMLGILYLLRLSIDECGSCM